MTNHTSVEEGVPAEAEKGVVEGGAPASRGLGVLEMDFSESSASDALACRDLNPIVRTAGAASSKSRLERLWPAEPCESGVAEGSEDPPAVCIPSLFFATSLTRAVYSV